MFRLPLWGVRVLDLTMAWAGPYATRLLADMGAEVIKVESAGNWDVLRSLTVEPQTTPHVYDRAPFFNHNNRNKYGVSLDLSSERGRELFLRLAEISDVVIDNFRPDVMENLRLTPDVLRERNERLIIVSMPGNGSTGPESGFVLYGTNVEQLSGLAHLSGYADGPPQKTGISYGDPLAGIAAAAAIALALWDRRRTGEGQVIEVAQREAMISVIGEYIAAHSLGQPEPERRGNRHSSMAPHGVYAAAGTDNWVAIACEDDAQFAALCAAIGQPAFASDERFADVVSRFRNQDVLDEIISAWTFERGKDEAASVLQAAGVPASAVETMQDVFEDPQLRARGFFEPVTHPHAGTWEIEGPHWRMSETPGHIRIPPPSFAEHNEYVLGSLLGLSAEEIAAFQAEGITAAAPDLGTHA
jgi:crotonobetainyl-CoA:carnitine CoA-transferase CaiB-like acyl-CoA transferase